MSIAVLVCLLIILLLLLVIIWQYYNYVKPVEILLGAARHIYEGNFSFEEVVQNRSDTGKLYALLNKINDKLFALDEKLKGKARELERATKSLDNFAYVVSHDLKGPFSSIKSIAELLHLEYETQFDEAGKELLSFIDIKVAEMDKLLTGILQFSRVRQSEEAEENVDFNEVVKEVIAEANLPANVAVHIDNILPTMHMEPDLVHKVFLNLIKNAVHFIDKTEGNIEIGSRYEGKNYTFYVKDNGVGIEPKYFEKIFNIFFTIKKEDAGEEGAGVGLAIVKKIIEYKGGTIWLESEPQKGTTFYFTLPEK